jgi:hypothetical protein
MFKSKIEIKQSVGAWIFGCRLPQPYQSQYVLYGVCWEKQPEDEAVPWTFAVTAQSLKEGFVWRFSPV